MRIETLLIANRGEIARRVIRTARAMDIRTVAVFSDADADAPFVHEADISVRLPGNAPGDTYLRADAVVAAARRAHADAIHPGYGFLSENAGFARACADADIVFVGPTPEAIEAMGSKTSAKELMAAAGVPVLPGIVIDDETDWAAGELAERISQQMDYPVLVKAAYGGGGRGMRIVRGPEEITAAVDSARREAATAFGNDTVFIERYVENPRHVEVQIMGDAHGNLVHLFERECSIQRRYQKIIEEAPSPVVDPQLRAELGEAAIAAGKAIGYVGAGTVEFVLDPAGRFYFLEVNTRLQVEHPVTELVTGLDLVRLQLLVAEGERLPEEVQTPTLTGHAVEARLCAEDVASGFLPATGQVHTFSIPDLPGIRVDAGVAAGSEVGVHYDSMLAKVIAYGPTRDAACRLLSRALAESRFHGVVTNRELLVGILREEEFRAGRIDTGYLSRHDPVQLARQANSTQAVSIHALAAALAAQAERRGRARVLATLPSGWRNVDNGPQQVRYTVDGAEVDVHYRLNGQVVHAVVDGERLPDVIVRRADPTKVDLDVDGLRHEFHLVVAGSVTYVDSVLGATALTEIARFPEPGDRTAPGSLLAPMPGTVVRVAAAVGDTVAAGAPVIILESMKMEHSVTAPAAGTVTSVEVTVGATVDLGTVLAVVEES